MVTEVTKVRGVTELTDKIEYYNLKLETKVTKVREVIEEERGLKAAF